MVTADDFECAIFDLDGTLVDSNSVWEKIDRMYMQKNRIFVSDKELHDMAAMTYEECFEFIKKKKPDINDYYGIWSDKEYMDAEELVKVLREGRRHSNSSRDEFWNK